MGYSPCSHKETDTTERLSLSHGLIGWCPSQEDPLPFQLASESTQSPWLAGISGGLIQFLGE